jgi:MFS family permease
MYLPVPLFGLLCDRYSPPPLSLLSAVLFGLGYLLAAFAYKAGPPPDTGGNGWPFWVMILSFVGIGAGTSCMYLSAVTTCAKNFGRGRYKGIVLSVPIAAFGLSGMWQSQVGEHLLFERNADGSKGDVDVHRLFLFLGFTLLAVGILGTFGLQIVGEEELIDEAVEELERSGFLEESQFFSRSRSNSRSYGTLGTLDRRPSFSAASVSTSIREEEERRKEFEEEEKAKKTWLLNQETRRFLKDRTMWWLAAGFFLVTGPGESFIINVRTLPIFPTISTSLTPPSWEPLSPPSRPLPLANHPPAPPQPTLPSSPSLPPSRAS